MKSGTALFLACLVLAVIVSVTCIRIELLNAQAGGILPREIREGANSKWRHGARKVVQEMAERDVLNDRIDLGEKDKWAVYFDDDGKVRPDVVFTEAEQKRIAGEVKRARVAAELHSWVAGMGLLQYLFAPLLLILSILLFLKNKRLELKSGGAVFGAIACVAMICMVYRGYFTSLGW